VNVEGQKLSAIYQTVALTAGVTVRTVQGWVQSRRLEGENNRACFVRLWAVARAMWEEAAREEATRRAVERHGFGEVEAVEFVAEVFRSAGLRPVGDRNHRSNACG
jgi:hypothetical protein